MLTTSWQVPQECFWRLSVAQYHAMIQAGIVTEDDPLELLEGWLVTKMAKNRPHSLTTQLTREALAALLPLGWYVDDQEPLTLADSEPEPDLMVVRGSRRDYQERHPGPGDVALVIEVADASLQRDRTLKQRLYAAARIPEYWIINLPGRQWEVYRTPSGPTLAPAYGQCLIYTASETVPLCLDGREVGGLDCGSVLP
jgi:Uma2 family endonuclease